MHKIEQFFNLGLHLLDNYAEDVACRAITDMLTPLLLDPETIEALNQPGRNVLYERVGGLTVLGHWHAKTSKSGPHDHGRTWAIYGVATGKTAMYEYDIIQKRRGRVDPGTCRLSKSYWVTPGMAFWYPTGMVHSHHTHGDSRLIRIEGFNLHRRELKPGGHHFIMVNSQ